MKLPAKIAACVLPLLLTGCYQLHWFNRSQAQPLAPPIEDALPPKPSPAPADLPPPVVTIPNPTPEPDVKLQPEAPPKPPVKHRKPAPPPPDTTQQASNGSLGVSAIGHLSSGEPSDLRRQTEESIAATENGLNGINRTLSDQEQKTASQIKEFLKQARAALGSGDVDGAQTLAAKAKVLLGELSH
ncbi:MAG: hypothetical protein ABSF70_02450 [Terracidiphilus sp.]